MGRATTQQSFANGLVEDEQARHDDDRALNGRRQPLYFPQPIIETLACRLFRARNGKIVEGGDAQIKRAVNGAGKDRNRSR